MVFSVKDNGYLTITLWAEGPARIKEFSGPIEK